MSAEQRRIFGTIWITYALYYLGRLNLSPALPAIAVALGVSRAEVGLLGTAFFWTYAVGQLVNGELGNHFRPHRIIAAGLLVIAVTNTLFAFQQGLIVMLILWAINGYAQSTGWGPMLGILSASLNPAQRKRISAFIPMSYQLGAAVSWALGGWLVVVGGWQSAFLVPGILLFGILVLWWFLGADKPVESIQRQPFEWRTILRDLRHLRLILVAGVFVGFVQVGGVIWIPTYVRDTGLFPDEIVGFMAGIIPILGLFGMYFASKLLERQENVRLVQVRLLTVSGLLWLVVAALAIPGWQLVVAGITLMLVSGNSALLLSAVPITLAAPGRASSTAGTITAIVNIGGGLAGVVIGGIVERFDWSAVFVVWSACSLIAMTLFWLSMTRGEENSGQGSGLSR